MQAPPNVDHEAVLVCWVFVDGWSQRVEDGFVGEDKRRVPTRELSARIHGRLPVEVGALVERVVLAHKLGGDDVATSRGTREVRVDDEVPMQKIFA